MPKRIDATQTQIVRDLRKAGAMVSLKRCPKCAESKPRSEFYKDPVRRDGLRPHCKPCFGDGIRRRKQIRGQEYREHQKRYRRAKQEHIRSFGIYDRQLWRQRAMECLGLACKRCGYHQDIRALQIDHVNSDGKPDRARFNSARSFYKYLVSLNKTELSARYQTLCANCNMIMKFERGEHGNGGKKNGR